MILQLRLHNWRAYENLDLELGPGTTFIVASNGTGKTSLILAAAWGIFGEASGVDAAEEIRGDADTASIEVVLRLPESGNMTIRRMINRKGKSVLEATLGGRTISEQEELRALIASELGGDLQVISRLTFLAHGGAMESDTIGQFQLREHLASVFGVTPLLEAARTADKLVTEATAAARKLKAGQKTDQAEKDKLLAAVAWVDEEMSKAAEGRAEAQAELSAADERRQAAAGWERYREALAESEAGLAALAARAEQFAPAGTVPAALTGALEQAETGIREALSTAEIALAAAEAQAAMIEESEELLRSAGATCPTCLRPMAEHESKAALAQHDTRLAQIKASIESARSSASDETARLHKLRSLLIEARTFALPAAPAGAELPGAATLEAYEQARTRVQELDQLMARLAAGKDMSLNKVAELEEAERQNLQIASLLRQEAVARAAGDAFRVTADAITREQIEPLVAEVGRRWKQIFGADGLRLSPVGEITREIGSRVLPFKSLSGGEKVWALLLTRLLVTGASTRAPFVWLDEPLEHLDPRLRRIVAGTLARASHTGGLRQVVVTTYESELARQLMEDVPAASLVYVRGAG